MTLLIINIIKKTINNDTYMCVYKSVVAIILMLILY